MIQSFVEERLNLAVDMASPAIIYGTVGGPQFNTTVIPVGGGYEARRGNWTESRGRWQIGDRLYSRAEWEYLRDFFWARRGQAVGFRFKDWSDYKVVGGFVGTGDSYTQQFQLVKNYVTATTTVGRKILKPVAGTVKVYFQEGGSGGEASPPDTPRVEQYWGIDVNYSSGLITCSYPPSYGASISADFEFDVPVRFDSDRLDSRFDAYRLEDGEAMYYVSNLPVVAISQTVVNFAPPPPPPPNS